MSGRWPSNFLIIHNPGCERVGVRRVKAGTWGATQNTQCGSSGTMNSGWAQRPTVNPSVAGPDGLETIDDWRCTKNCPARKLGEQSSRRKSGALTRSETARAEAGKHGIYGQYKGKPDGKHFPANEGTAARFYFQADWSYERIEEEELWNGNVESNL